MDGDSDMEHSAANHPQRSPDMESLGSRKPLTAGKTGSGPVQMHRLTKKPQNWLETHCCGVVEAHTGIVTKGRTGIPLFPRG
jgi:hypothetical protein